VLAGLFWVRRGVRTCTRSKGGISKGDHGRRPGLQILPPLPDCQHPMLGIVKVQRIASAFRGYSASSPDILGMIAIRNQQIVAFITGPELPGILLP